MMALSLHYLGDQAGTCACALRTINAPIAPDRHLQTIHYGSDQRVGAFVILARALWLQGFADRAIRAAQAGSAEAGTSGYSQIRFADAHNGFAYGPDLYATHDGGTSWHAVEWAARSQTWRSRPGWCTRRSSRPEAAAAS